MKRVTGIGGLFFKSADPEKLTAWYVKHLGLPVDGSGYVVFNWREMDGQTIWSPFPQDTESFGNSKSPFMINFRVADLDAVLDSLREEGVEVDDKIEESEYGRFGWITDPEGNRIELWQPPEKAPES